MTGYIQWSLITLHLLLFIDHPNCVQCEYYSAVVDMMKAVQISQDLVSDLHAYLDIQRKHLDEIEELVNSVDHHLYMMESNTSKFDVEMHISNPLYAFHLFEKLAFGLKHKVMDMIENRISILDPRSDKMENKMLSHLIHRVEERANLLPGNQDVLGVTDALLRLQSIYKLSAKHLSKGIITNSISGPPMNAAQCLHVGQQAYSHKDYQKAGEWFEAAYDMLVESADDQSSSSAKLDYDAQQLYEKQPRKTVVLDHLAYAMGRQGRYEEALGFTNMLMGIEPDNEIFQQNADFYSNALQNGEGIFGPATDASTLTNYQQETVNYEALCRGDQIFAAPKSQLLYCRYYVPHAYYKIGPVKEEILFPDPRIVMWHDIIHPNEIESIKTLATPNLERAGVKNAATGIPAISPLRTSKSAWLMKGLNNLTKSISQRIHMVTGLDMESAEDLQVGNYGLGGHYAPHFDFVRKRERDPFDIIYGNRISTIIFYLSDVEAGGATVFNRVGARVVPKMGAAAFWDNLFSNGEGDLRTKHAGCPVLIGSKWVVNVWFHERGQEFTRPCNLERDPIETVNRFQLKRSN